MPAFFVSVAPVAQVAAREEPLERFTVSLKRRNRSSL
jgi:hypothetical protein